MKKTTVPVIFPREGVYERSGIHFDFDCLTPGAAVHFTMDGSQPTAESPVYHRDDGLVLLPDIPAQRGRSVSTQVQIKAFAVADGCEPSETVTFHYEVRHRATDQYISEFLRPLSDDAPALLRISDYDDESMYLLVGTERALLIDAGLDRNGDLPGYVRSIIGDKPCDVVITHCHIDHYGQAWNLKDAGFPIYMNHADIELGKKLFGDDLSFTLPLAKGQTFDLGNTVLKTFTIPGHTAAGTVLVDEKNGDAFTGDAIGSPVNSMPGALLLHFGNPEGVVDRILPAYVQFLRKEGKYLQHIHTGHNNNVIDASALLPVMEKMLQNAVDLGDAARKPTLRPLSDGLTSSPHVIYEGNFRMAMDWNSANVDKLFSPGLTAENMSLLADLYAETGMLEPEFDPNVTEYTWHSADANDTLALRPMSTRCASVTVNGIPVSSGEAFGSADAYTIEVIAPDGTTKTVYRIQRVDT